MPMRPRPQLLLVHDDGQTARQLAKMTSEIAELIIVRSATRLNATLDSNPLLSVVVVGKPSNSDAAIDILSAVRTRCASARTILLSDPADLSRSIEALHSGLVDHVLDPPLRERELTAIMALPSPRPPTASPGIATARRTV